MSTLRAFALAAMLVAVTASAQAQRWGGGGPGVSQSAQPPYATSHARQFPPHDAPYAASPAASPAAPYVRTRYAPDNRRQVTGGSWDGSRPTWGGSPPRAREPRADLSEFFGYVAPRTGAAAPRAGLQPPQRTTREAYLERYRKP